jgi:hypothetical protein
MMTKGTRMRKYSDQQFANTAECNFSAYRSMFADACLFREVTAIIALMAVILFVSVYKHLVTDILISVILGIIILIVRRKSNFVSRTR